TKSCQSLIEYLRSILHLISTEKQQRNRELYSIELRRNECADFKAAPYSRLRVGPFWPHCPLCPYSRRPISNRRASPSARLPSCRSPGASLRKISAETLAR